jgi:hypothetical protein
VRLENLQIMYIRSPSPCHMQACRMPEPQAWGIMLLLHLLHTAHKWSCKGVGSRLKSDNSVPSQTGTAWHPPAAGDATSGVA